MTASLARHTLQKDLWPDKALFGSVLLVLTGFLGLVHGLLDLVGGVEFNVRYLPFLSGYPAWLTAALGAAAIALAIVSLRLRRIRFALVGAGLAFVSFGLVFLVPALALLSAAFLLRGRFEGEDTRPETLRLTARMWPDKSLAASLLLLLTGLLTVGWWGGILLGNIEVEALGRPWAYATVGLVLGLLCLAGARTLYYQRAPWLGVAAALGGILGGAILVVGPLLSLVSLVLIGLAWREREFREALVP